MERFSSPMFAAIFCCCCCYVLANVLLSHDVPIPTLSIILIDISSDQSVLTGEEKSSSAYDVALDRASQMFPRVFQNMRIINLIVPGNFSCLLAEGEMVVWLSSFYVNLSSTILAGPTFMLAPGCSLEVTTLGHFARELDVPVLASTAADPKFTNHDKFPTVIAMGPSEHRYLIRALISLLRNFKWPTVSVICDARSLDTYHNSWMLMFCKTLATSPAVAAHEIDAMIISVDSSVKDDFYDNLQAAKAHSAVLVFVTVPVTQRRLMAQAVSLGMNDTNFVFLYFRLPEFPYYDNTWTQTDQETQIALVTLPFSYEISVPPPDMEKLDDWSLVLEKQHGKNINILPEELQVADVNQVSAYHSVLMLAEVLNDSYDYLQFITGIEFTSLFFNRTFRLPGQNVTISHNGIRQSDVLISRFCSAYKVREVKWIYHSHSGILSPTFSTPELSFWPPKEQACVGLNNAYCTWLRSSNNYDLYWLLFALIFSFSGILIAGIICRRKLRTKENEWWFIPDSEVSYNPITKPIHLAGQLVNTNAEAGPAQKFEVAVYKDKTLQAVRFESTLTFEDILRNKPAMRVLRMIKKLDHPNITKFYGISFVKHEIPKQIAILTESGKCLLRDLIDNDNNEFNWDLRFSLIWDLINGLQYLHSTPVRCHGVVTFLNLVIDNHFTLKLARAGKLQLYASLTAPGKPFRNPLPLVFFLWMAPEIMGDPENAAHSSPAADIYSVGIALYELATRNAPFNIDVTNMVSISETIRLIQGGKLNVRSYPMPGIPPVLEELVFYCWSADPAQRPTIKQVKQALINVHPLNNKSFADNVVARLELHSRELEFQVALRTKALLDESHKVDELLSTLFPLSVVRKLRNHQAITPKLFESMSVLFSDIPAFDRIVDVCTPFEIVDLLHRLYSTLDNEVIPQFKVYKVETIKDSYMVASGLPEPNGTEHAAELSRLALKMLTAGHQVKTLNIDCVIGNLSEYLELRIGISSGPCVAAVMGQKLPHYCLVGDTVNMASRMETYGEESKIHISSATFSLLDTNRFLTKCRGLLAVKGKGLVTSYWLFSEWISQQIAPPN